MLQINPEYLERQTAPDECPEPLVKPSQGEVWPPNPAANEATHQLRHDRARSTPMWQAVLRA